jgi:hypothetical protein
MRIKCYTLYDITQTNVNFRKKNTEIVPADEMKKRSQQSNFETILQIINMRSQPEEISNSELTVINIDDLKDFNFGYLYEKSYNKTISKINVWSFTFSVDHADVFNNGINDLGSLSDDCNQVPMILKLEETFKLSNQMNISDEQRNIYFEVLK